MQYFMPMCQKFARTAHANKGEVIPMSFQSALIDHCIQSATDVFAGGAKYTQVGTMMLGGIDLANSMAAVKKCVYDEKQISISQLVGALKNDFEGMEHIRSILINAPKYGNDNDYVDSLAKDWYDIAWEEHQKAPPFPSPESVLVPQAYSVTSHVWFGVRTGALPSGKKAGASLTDASVSPMPGTDVNGPTALIKSAAQAIDTVKYGSNHLNMKFLPTVFAGEESNQKFIDMVKVYMAIGGCHVQFNCVSNDILKDAQVHPENHRDLVVRVAGFSAYYIHLQEEVQNEIIKRNELTF